MAEYHPVTEDHRARYHAIMQQAFDPESGPEPSYAAGDADEDPEDWPPDLSDPRGLFVEGPSDGADGTELVSTCKLYYLDATVRGEWTEIGGLGGVATPPEHRRQGYSRETIRGALREYREHGVDFVALWPSTVRFYRGLGWGTAAWTTKADVPPEQLAAIDGGSGDSGAGRFRQLDVEDWERLRKVEVARAERFGLSLRRSEDWWRKRTLAPWPGETAPYVHGYEVDGELRGHVLSQARGGEDDRRLDVQDLAGVDHATERRLLGWLANFDSQVASIHLQGPLAADLPELVPDPGELDVERTVGSMIRLTDVERGLEGLSWPGGARGAFALEVDDPLLDRNDGTFVVDVADGTATVKSAGVDRETDAVVGVGTLSRLAIGAIGVDRAGDWAIWKSVATTSGLRSTRRSSPSQCTSGSSSDPRLPGRVRFIQLRALQSSESKSCSANSAVYSGHRFIRQTDQSRRMSTPSADGDDAPEDLEETLEERAREVLEDEECVTFEEHNDERED